MSFGSVVRSMCSRRDPLTVFRAGYGREVIGSGRGTVAVMTTSDLGGLIWVVESSPS